MYKTAKFLTFEYFDFYTRPIIDVVFVHHYHQEKEKTLNKY